MMLLQDHDIAPPLHAMASAVALPQSRSIAGQVVVAEGGEESGIAILTVEKDDALALSYRIAMNKSFVWLFL